MRIKKFYTVKQWNCFKDNDYFDMQDMLCQKYDVILTDHKTRKEKITFILNKFNQRNFNKGMIQFNRIMKDFGKFMDQFSQEIDPPKHKKYRKRKSSSNRKNHNNLIWENSNNSIPLWGSSESNFDSQSRHEANLEKIWGKRK